VQAFTKDPLSRVADLNLLINQLTIIAFLTKMAFSVNFTPVYSSLVTGYPSKHKLLNYEVDLTGTKGLTPESLLAWKDLKVG